MRRVYVTVRIAKLDLKDTVRRVSYMSCVLTHKAFRTS